MQKLLRACVRACVQYRHTSLHLQEGVEAQQIEVRRLKAELDEKGIEKKIQVYTEKIYSNPEILWRFFILVCEAITQTTTKP